VVYTSNNITTAKNVSFIFLGKFKMRNIFYHRGHKEGNTESADKKNERKKITNAKGSVSSVLSQRTLWLIFYPRLFQKKCVPYLTPERTQHHSNNVDQLNLR
jgi:hypothetical protein